MKINEKNPEEQVQSSPCGYCQAAAVDVLLCCYSCRSARLTGAVLLVPAQELHLTVLETHQGVLSQLSLLCYHSFYHTTSQTQTSLHLRIPIVELFIQF